MSLLDWFRSDNDDEDDDTEADDHDHEYDFMSNGSSHSLGSVDHEHGLIVVSSTEAGHWECDCGERMGQHRTPSQEHTGRDRQTHIGVVEADFMSSAPTREVKHIQPQELTTVFDELDDDE